MPEYRLYTMCPFTGHIQRFDDFLAGDDSAATTRAQRHEGDDPLEVWCGHRKVTRIEAVDVATRMIERRRDRMLPGTAQKDTGTR